MSHAPNRLIRSSSPYLLQHAHNPVDWYPWSEEAFERAVREDKLVLISIGYSACHWCHVMERESFEDPEVATVMNDHFVCIKVDREERPDVDQVYMSAVQLLTGSGGWPLNCFALPDGRPVYGGTYFPKNRWIEVLVNLSEMYRNNKVRLEGYAAQLAAGVQEEDRLPVTPQPSAANAEILDAAVQKWKAGLDQTEGGPNRAPKFPLPSNYRYLLVRAIRHRDSLLLDHVRLTLKKMAFGGIYDQIGGGFCRYSVDAVWKVPHFEKMLYDNAQLISLYAEAYKYFKEPLYQQIATSTIDFVLRELCGPQHHFFSALDADSEGEEGKFYVWQPAEVEQILGMDAPLFMDYFSMNEAGYWEHGNYILLRKEETTVVASRHGMSAEQAESIIQNCRVKLMDSRSRRIRPGLDDKTLTSWNAMMITALLDAYDAFGEQRFLDAATRNAAFISNQLIREDGGLWHSWKVTPSVNGYLEDYAFVAQAFIRMYQCTFQRSWIDQARDLCMYALDHFASEGSPLLHFTSDLDPPLFARKQELQDQVIPSSNSQMAWNLYLLGRYYDREGWMSRARQMWNAIAPRVKFYPSAWSNWMLLAESLDHPPEEVVICGEQALQERSEWASAYHLFTLIGGCVKSDGMPWTLHRVPDQGTQVFRCVNHTCSLPVASIAALPEGL